MKTRTGNYPIGFRIGWTDWQKDLAALAAWGKQTGFELLDLTAASPDDVRAVQSAGLDVVSVDLLDWPGPLSEDSGKRKANVDKNIARFADMAELGVKVIFSVVIPENPNKPATENFTLAVESYGAMAEAAEKHGMTIVLEGWPGGPPYPNLCCNPETCRAMFKEVPSRGLGFNYDPSHLIRMGIDHLRFVEEFADRIGHVHGKDTELLSENLYDVGIFQASLYKKPFFCGEFAWRYTIPGHGATRWSRVFEVLSQAGFNGAVSVELEDATYNGTEEGEKTGLIASLNYLNSV